MAANTPYPVFPVLYVADEYQPDAKWTSLTRTLCDLLVSSLNSIIESVKS